MFTVCKSLTYDYTGTTQDNFSLGKDFFFISTITERKCEKIQ